MRAWIWDLVDDLRWLFGRGWERDLAAYEALYAADTTALAASRMRQAVTVPADTFDFDCPIAGCRSCVVDVAAYMARPAARPDYSEHQWPAARQTDAVVHWMRFSWPDAWYDTEIDTAVAVADRLLLARAQAMTGVLSEGER